MLCGRYRSPSKTKERFGRNYIAFRDAAERMGAMPINKMHAVVKKSTDTGDGIRLGCDELKRGQSFG